MNAGTTSSCNPQPGWIDPKHGGAQRNGKKAFLYVSEKAFNQVFMFGYALGRGPCGEGYYSFDTKQAYVIVIKNLKSKKSRLKSIFGGKKAKQRQKTIRDMIALCEARLSLHCPQAIISEMDIISRGGDPSILKRCNVKDLSIEGQSGRETALAASEPAAIMKNKFGVIF